jgi:pimeloyl-ACP methyl ester carboxylesterase
LTELRDWLVSELDARPAPALLAGHSMGAALAVLAAALAPERVSELVLLAPAGVPLDKPLTASLRELGRQLAGRIHRLPELVASAAHLLRDPVGAVRVERELRMLDLSAELETLRSRGMPAVVIGCSTDTLIPVQDCRSIAEALGARYREVALDWGHVWMLADPPALARELAELA